MNELVARLTLFFVLLMSARVAVMEPETKAQPRTFIRPKAPVGEPRVLPQLQQLFPPDKIERIKNKELRRYKLAQDKKWANWLEAVSQ